jgi:hypothetical protein
MIPTKEAVGNFLDAFTANYLDAAREAFNFGKTKVFSAEAVAEAITLCTHFRAHADLSADSYAGRLFWLARNLSDDGPNPVALLWSYSLIATARSYGRRAVEEARGQLHFIAAKPITMPPASKEFAVLYAGLSPATSECTAAGPDSADVGAMMHGMVGPPEKIGKAIAVLLELLPAAREQVLTVQIRV